MNKVLVLTAAALFILSGLSISVYAGSVTRSISEDVVNVSEDVSVTLQVSISSGEDFYFIDEIYPAGFAVINRGLLHNDEAGHLKIAVIENPVSTSYAYVIRAPSSAGFHTFSGNYGIDGAGSTQNTGGESSLTVVSCLQNEICNGIDDNCNIQIDEGFDNDNDGYFPDDNCTGYASYDCNNNNASIHPGATENCLSVDMNCNGLLYDNLSCPGSPFIVTTDYFNGRTTNFSAMNNFSFVNDVILERLGHGIIKFKSRVNFTKAVNLRPSAGIELSKNKLLIDTAQLPFFNKPANITFYNISFKNPFVLRDGEPCLSSICSGLKVEGINISFSVTGFSEYSIEGKCDDGTVYEECSSSRPNYCNENGELVYDCSMCPCPSGLSCISGVCTAGGNDNDQGNGGGPECTSGNTKACGNSIGACMQGIMECVAGKWSECRGSVEPSPELCDGTDNNCDGQVDNGISCECLIGNTKQCGNTIGACKAGIRTCLNGIWNIECIGGMHPTIELCDGIDNDCDNEIDENCTVPENATCSDGNIPEEGCFCGGMLRIEGYCYNNGFRETPIEPFPWLILVIFGGILLVVLVAEVIHHSHKEKKKVTWESLEQGFRQRQPVEPPAPPQSGNEDEQ